MSTSAPERPASPSAVPAAATAPATPPPYGLVSCLYEGYVRHRRTAPRPHNFRYPVRYAYLDLAELDRVFALSPLWGRERRAPVSFRRADYLGPAELPLDEAVRARAEELLGMRPAGPIRLLTGLGTLGWGFNPVSFYYCFEPDGERLACVLAEITNTPWGQRHTYALPAKEDRTGAHQRFPKRFHVSPFVDLDVRYDWTFNLPGERLAVHMEDIQQGDGKDYIADGQRLFDATLVLKRRALDARSARALALRQPSFPLFAHFGIYLQAALLFLKRVPFYSHPEKR